MMLLEGFVQAVGAMMGHSRDLFGVGGGAGMMPMSVPSPPLAAGVTGSGLAASASNTDAGALAGLVSALGEQDLAAHSGLESALAAGGTGRGEMDAVIGGALGDITGLAPATTSPAGQQALVGALTRRLEQTWHALTNGNTAASTFAASSAQVAAAYNGLGTNPVGGLGVTAPMGAISPMGTMASSAAMSTMSTMPMLAAGQMAASQSALSGSPVQSSVQQQQPLSNSVDQSASQVKNAARQHKVNTVIHRAMQQRGKPYVWGGGGPNGPTKGGFDCSGLALYAYAPYVTLPHKSELQMHFGTEVARKDIRPGDLIFSRFSASGAGHVQMAIGYGANSPIVEAPHSGARVHTGPIESGRIVVKRIFH
jgi:cell wall-associated NlpC family hydrolase